MTTTTVRTNAWHGDQEQLIRFPEHWDLTVIGSTAHALSDDGIQQAIRHPIGSEPLSRLAKGKQSIVVIVDDLNRPTPAGLVLPAVLDELEAAGAKDSEITLMLAGGTHQPADQQMMAKKLGNTIANRYRTVAHDAKKDTLFLGKTNIGTPVHVSRTVAQADFRVAIGCVTPHGTAGFSGGDKIIMPGVCGLETVAYAHRHCRGARRRAGRVDNEFRREMSAIADQIGIEFLINVTLTNDRRVAQVFAGHRRAAFDAAVEHVRRCYSCTIPRDVDVIITDTYPYDTTLLCAKDRGFWPTFRQPAARRMRIVLAACPEGLGSHELVVHKNDIDPSA